MRNNKMQQSKKQYQNRIRRAGAQSAVMQREQLTIIQVCGNGSNVCFSQY